MAITLTQEPQAYQPAYNPILYQGVSSNYASSGFYYTIVVQDLITAVDSPVYRINPNPTDGYFIFDASPFIQNYFVNYLPIGLAGVQLAAGGVRRFSVIIKGYNTAGGGTPLETSTNYFYGWNGAIDRSIFADYNYLDYIFDGSGATNIKYLSDVTQPYTSYPEYTYSNRSNYFYYLSQDNNDDFEAIVIYTYDSTGAYLGTSEFANPHQASASYTDKYICFDIGKKGLDAMLIGDVTGTYPILPANTAYYYVSGRLPTSSNYFFKKIIIKCSKQDVYSIHALFANGNFRSIHFDKVSEQSTNVSRKTYKQIHYENTAHVYGYTTYSANEKVLSTSEDRIIKLRTDWLTDEECELYRQLITSPLCYLDDGTSYYQVIPMPNSYKINKRSNDLFYLEMDFKYTLPTTRQRG